MLKALSWQLAYKAASILWPFKGLFPLMEILYFFQHVMDIGISILIYAYLYCLKLLIVTLYRALIGFDCFKIIE
jgi:hypothetical protein